MPFNKGMRVEEALNLHPGAKAVFKARGLPCDVCIVAERETIAEAARLNGLDADAIVEKLNRLPETTEESSYEGGAGRGI